MTSFELLDPDAFSAGTVGPPGQRVFYLQVREDNLIVSVRCEKQQVTALAEYFDGLLDNLDQPPIAATGDDAGLIEPVVPIWTLGQIGVRYEDPQDKIVVVLEELVVREVDEDEDEPDDDDLEELSGDTVTVRLSRAQVAGFVRQSRALVSAGRPPCRFCGLPVDPGGHPCPRMN